MCALRAKKNWSICCCYFMKTQGIVQIISVWRKDDKVLKEMCAVYLQISTQLILHPSGMVDILTADKSYIHSSGKQTVVQCSNQISIDVRFIKCSQQGWGWRRVTAVSASPYIYVRPHNDVQSLPALPQLEYLI